MGRALELIAGQATAPSTTFTALTMNAGNSLTVRNAPLDADTRIIQMWAKHQAAGVFRVRSPKLHDFVQGMRFRNPAALAIPMMPPGGWQRVVPQDTLTAELTGSAVGGQFEQGAMMVYYSNLPGNDARMTTYADALARTVNIMAQEVSITPGVAGGYSGQVAINSGFDTWKANTDYALLGYRVDVRCTAVRIFGADTSNLGVGGPGEPSIAEQTARWFLWLSYFLNLALVPVFNSANKFGILTDIMQDQAGAVVVITWIFGELTPGAVKTS